MTCKRCGSNNLWDDNLSWGCDDCGYSEINGHPSFIFAKDKPGLPRSIAQMEKLEQFKRDNERYSE